MDVKQLYNAVPQRVRVSWSQAVEVRVAVRGSENQLPAESLGPHDPRLSSPAEWEKKSCYSQRTGFNMLQSVQSPTHLSHTTLSQPFRIKCERYIFFWRSVLVRHYCLFCFRMYMYTYSCITAIQQFQLMISNTDNSIRYQSCRQWNSFNVENKWSYACKKDAFVFIHPNK